MRVAFISREPQADSIYPRVCALLEARGVEVDSILADRALFTMSDLAPAADLHVLRARTLTAYSAALALSAAGARFLVPLDRERVVRNRFLTQQILIEAGIPAPRAWIVDRPEALAELVSRSGPMVVKPPDVGAGKGVRIVRSAAEVPHELLGPVFAQEIAPHLSADIKLYGIGSRVWAIRRPFPARTPKEKAGEAITPTPEMMEIAERCRRAFGLVLYGVDLLEADRGLVVVDVNSTPGYKGVCGAAEAIADVICAGGESR